MLVGADRSRQTTSDALEQRVHRVLFTDERHRRRRRRLDRQPRAARQRRQQRAEQLGVRGQAARDPRARPGRAPTSRSAPATSSSSTTPTPSAQQIHFWSTDDRDALPRRPSDRRSSADYLQPEEAACREGLPHVVTSACSHDAPDDAPAVERDRDPAHPARLRPGPRRRRGRARSAPTSSTSCSTPSPAASRVGLDFVYGEVDGRHAAAARRPAAPHHPVPPPLVPRLARGPLDRGAPWKRFSYATRPSARLLLRAPRRASAAARRRTVPSSWINDQPWYLYMWRHDPTIQSMLVMLDAIHERLHRRRRRRRMGRGSTDAETPGDLVPPPAARRHGVAARTSTSR